MALKRQLPLDWADSTRHEAICRHNFLTVTAKANVWLGIRRSSPFLPASANQTPRGAMRRVTAQSTLHKLQITHNPEREREAAERWGKVECVNRQKQNVTNKYYMFRWTATEFLILIGRWVAGYFLLLDNSNSSCWFLFILMPMESWSPDVN